MKPEVKIFSRSNPCTKLDFWKCFRNPKPGAIFRMVDVATAHSIIGERAPQNWINKGYLDKTEVKDADIYVLTKAGVDHLKQGIVQYVNSPAHKGLNIDSLNLPKSLASQVSVQ